MNLESQVCSLELAKKLKELGVEQKSIFVWEYYDENCYTVKYIPYAVMPSLYEKDKIQIYSAFTSDELMEKLPACIDTKQNEPFNFFWLQIRKRSAKNIQYIAKYICDSIPGEEISNPMFEIDSPIKVYDENFANCLAKILIYLIENDLLNKGALK